MTFTSVVIEVQSARKDHQCEWCGTLIEQGQPYDKWTTVDGGWYTTKMHPECYQACLRAGVEEIYIGENWRGSYCEKDRYCKCRSDCDSE